jgi:putative toxin-antitoxin system antitoxin component (TIGR02293 family)
MGAKNNSPKNKALNGNKPFSEANEAVAVYYTLPSAFKFLGNFNNGTTRNVVEGKYDFIDLIRKGVSRKALDFLMETTGITPLEMAAIMHTSDRTLRRYTASKLLNPEQSERVIELARLYSRGEEVFGSLDAFKEWIESNVIALGNKKPKEFFDTSLGIELLMEELGRIEHGIFA